MLLGEASPTTLPPSPPSSRGDGVVGLAVAGGGGGRGMTSALYCSSSKLLYSGMTSSLSLLSTRRALFESTKRRECGGGRAGKVVVCGVIMRWCCGDRVCAVVGATKISESIISFSILCLVIIVSVYLHILCTFMFVQLFWRQTFWRTSKMAVK